MQRTYVTVVQYTINNSLKKYLSKGLQYWIALLRTETSGNYTALSFFHMTKIKTEQAEMFITMEPDDRFPNKKT